MSEYRYVAFRAIDKPVSQENLEFMREQSTRAEITPWTFDNTYHYGNFKGDPFEMLRRGYDFFFDYSNYGGRVVAIRLPQGFRDPSQIAEYEKYGPVRLVRDKSGPGACLEINCDCESAYLEDSWDLEAFLDTLIPLRQELIDGDPRSLYIACLADSYFDDSVDGCLEPPLPAGIGAPSPAQLALAEFLGVSRELIAAAALESLPHPGHSEGYRSALQREWIQRQPIATKNAWLTAIMSDVNGAVRNDMLVKFWTDYPPPPWPTSKPGRSLGLLYDHARQIADWMEEQEAQEEERQRLEEMRKLAANPEKVIREIEKLVDKKSTHAYQQAVSLLADLRDALAGNKNLGMIEELARRLKSKHPTRRQLIHRLKVAGF